MAESGYVLPAPEMVSMTGEAARKIIGCGSGDAALVYLYIVQSGGRYDALDCARHTGRTAEQLERAYAVLERLGLVTPSAPPKPERPEEIPEYTTEDVKRELENGEDFRYLAGEVERTMGRLLSGDELVKLYGIYDYAELPSEVIALLVRYCVSDVQRRTPGRRPSMRYIEKAALAWRREGIFSIEAAEHYVEREAERRSAYAEFARAMNVRDRLLSDTERRYVDSWREMGFGAEAIAIATDRTLTQTGKRGMPYMDKIVRSWHAKGLHTPEEIERGDSFAGPRPASGGRNQNPKNTAVTRADAEKNRAALRRIREG